MTANYGPWPSTFNPNVSGGGGGGPTTGSTLVMGPDYGEGSGTDGSTLAAGAGAALGLTEYEASPVAATGSDLDSLDAVTNISAMSAASLSRLVMDGSLGSSASDGWEARLSVFPTGDTYLDRGTPTIPRGASTTLLAKTNTPVTNDDKNTYMAWNLTAFGSGSGTKDGTLRVRISSNDLVSAQTLNYQWYTHSAQPFVEATATWNTSEPPPGTARTAGTVSVAQGAAQIYNLTLPAADLNSALLSGWLYIRFTGRTGLGGDLTTFTIDSKEAVTSGNRPLLTIDVALS